MKNKKIARAFFTVFILWIMATTYSCQTGSEPETDPTYTVMKASNLYYDNDNHHKHTLDVYYPSEKTGCRVVVFVPGGAWRQGDKDKYSEMANTLVKNYGFVFVAVNYRLSNEMDGSAVHPDHVEDVAAAFQWVAVNIAQYNGNSSYIFLFGQSAGAHLVSLLATDARYLNNRGYGLNNVKGVITMSGAYALNDFAAFPLNPLGLTAEEVLMYKAIFFDAFGSWNRSALDPASPSKNINAAQPPFLVIHSEVDMPGFVSDGTAFHNLIISAKGSGSTLMGLTVSDYSEATWTKATELAASEPMLAEYIGHYAEVVAINEVDKSKAPTIWIVSFINK